MSAKKVFPYKNKMLDAQQVANMKYPIAKKQTVLKLLNKGMTVQEVLDYDINKGILLGRQRARAINKLNRTDFQIKD